MAPRERPYNDMTQGPQAGLKKARFGRWISGAKRLWSATSQAGTPVVLPP